MLTFNKLGRYGRLGNQMFQIASTIGIARKNGYDVGFPAWMNYDAVERFGSDEDIDVGKWFPNFREYVKDERPQQEHFMQWGFNGFGVPDNVSLCGHMQSEKYFKHCEGEIRYLFRANAALFHGESCAIHIRLSDYSTQAGYHPVQSMEYYENAMREIGDVNYVVYSDDINEAKRIFSEWFPLRSFTYVGGNVDPSHENLTQMSLCRHFITANSTFSWWAAWLGTHPDKKIVMPSNWFGPEANLDPKDIYIENAIII